MIAKLFREFASRQTKIICISAADVDRHEAWVRDVEETQSCKVRFPIVADETGDLLTKLLMRRIVDGEPGPVMPTVMIVDHELTVRFTMVTANGTGRNFYEVLRVIDSLQLASYFKVATPAHWMAGDPVFVLPSVADEAAEAMFPKGVTVVPMGDSKACRQTPYPDVETDPAIRDDV